LRAQHEVEILVDLCRQTGISQALESLYDAPDRGVRVRVIVHWPEALDDLGALWAAILRQGTVKHGWAVRSVKTTPSVEFVIVDAHTAHQWQGPDGGAYSRASDLATCAYLRTHFEDVWATSEIGGHEIVFEDVVAPSPDAYRTEIRGLSVDTWDRVIAELAAIPSRLHSMNGRAFEELVAELLNRDGMEVQLTQPTRDGGRDILAWTAGPTGRHLFLVECKRYAPSRPIGVDIVRALYGVVEQERATAGLIVTTSRFTPDARAFAAPLQYRMSLKDYEELVAWVGRCMTGRAH
jgi:HJR/Mrr/RecB family endonuclease